MAMKFDYLNLESLTRITAVANTPMYLYRHFRNESSVEEFSKSATTVELFSYVQELARKRSRTFEDTVLGYAALIAITFKPSSEIRKLIDEHGIPRLPWSYELLEGHLATSLASKLIVVTYNSAAALRNPDEYVGTTASPPVQQEAISPLIPNRPVANVANNSATSRILLDGVNND